VALVQAPPIVHVEAATGDARVEGAAEIPAAAAERLACDARAQVLLHDRTANRLYLGRARRLASPAQIAALTVRDGLGCRFPGCSHTRHLHAHHERPWLRGGCTDLDNLVLICSFHYRLVHDHVYRIRTDNGRWVFQRQNGGAIPEVCPPLIGGTESLLELHAPPSWASPPPGSPRTGRANGPPRARSSIGSSPGRSPRDHRAVRNSSTRSARATMRVSPTQP